MKPSLESLQLVEKILHELGFGAPMTAQQTVSTIAEMIEKHVNERIHDYELRHPLTHDR
jgi:hypothetical protein